MITPTAELVERLAAIAWKASQDAAFDKWYESGDDERLFPVKWPDRTDEERDTTRAGVQALLEELDKHDVKAEVFPAVLTTQLAKAICAGRGQPWDGYGSLSSSYWESYAESALTFLETGGRLVPEGGMSLTAEQVEDVRTVVNSRFMNGEYKPVARLRETFPPREPIEALPEYPACTECGVVSVWHSGFTHPFAGYPAPGFEPIDPGPASPEVIQRFAMAQRGQSPEEYFAERNETRYSAEKTIETALRVTGFDLSKRAL